MKERGPFDVALRERERFESAFHEYAVTLIYKPHHCTPDMFPDGSRWFKAGWDAALARSDDQDQSTKWSSHG